MYKHLWIITTTCFWLFVGAMMTWAIKAFIYNEKDTIESWILLSFAVVVAAIDVILTRLSLREKNISVS